MTLMSFNEEQSDTSSHCQSSELDSYQLEKNAVKLNTHTHMPSNRLVCISEKFSIQAPGIRPVYTTRGYQVSEEDRPVSERTDSVEDTHWGKCAGSSQCSVNMFVRQEQK